MKYKILLVKSKYIFVILLLLLLFSIMDLNPSTGVNFLPIAVLMFTVSVGILLIWPYLKSVFIIISNISFLIMVIFFVLNLPDIANIFGSLGFGILIIASLFYLPQLFKYGYIEKL